MSDSHYHVECTAEQVQLYRPKMPQAHVYTPMLNEDCTSTHCNALHRVTLHLRHSYALLLHHTCLGLVDNFITVMFAAQSLVWPAHYLITGMPLSNPQVPCV